jgi:uncharacterized protein (TIGR00369 family)
MAAEPKPTFQVRIPFVQLLGMELQRFEPGSAEIHLDLREELTNSWGVAHGGVTMTLLDVVMALAGRSPVKQGAEPLPGVVTIEMKTSFLRPGEGRLIATGRRLHHTASLAYCDGFVHNTEGLLLGHASGTFKFMKGLPVAGGRRIQRLNASD